MKESKTSELKIRLTDLEKKRLRNYAMLTEQSMSQAMKTLCKEIFEGDEDLDADYK